jgi:hypothetical protein
MPTATYDEIISIIKSGSYKIDPDNGTIFSCLGPGGRHLPVWYPVGTKCEGSDQGYLLFRFTINGIRYRISVHRAVWIYENGFVPEELEINHKDGNKLNNKIKNLELMTRKENQDHARKNGLWDPRCPKPGNRGKRNGKPAALSPQNVHEIRNLATSNCRLSTIAKKFNVSVSTISSIRTGRIYGWLEKRDGFEFFQRTKKRGGRNFAKLSEDDVKSIKNKIKNKERGIDIAKEFNVIASTITAIKQGRTWTDIV